MAWLNHNKALMETESKRSTKAEQNSLSLNPVFKSLFFSSLFPWYCLVLFFNEEKKILVKKGDSVYFWPLASASALQGSAIHIFCIF